VLRWSPVVLLDWAPPQPLASVEVGFAGVATDMGTPRVLVNCAGIGPAAKTVSRGAAHDPAVFETVIKVNLLGSFNCASQAAALMVAADPVAPDRAGGLCGFKGRDRRDDPAYGA